MTDSANTTSTPSATLPGPRPEDPRDHWGALYAEWLCVQAEWNDPAFMAADTGDDASRRGEREHQLARDVMVTPAPLSWMVQKKFEIFEHYLGGSDSWTDKRLIVMLAAIRADLMRFGIGHDAQKF